MERAKLTNCERTVPANNSSARAAVKKDRAKPKAKKLVCR
jgi:hypothetical protein